jgi:hypothetical protein
MRYEIRDTGCPELRTLTFSLQPSAFGPRLAECVCLFQPTRPLTRLHKLVLSWPARRAGKAGRGRGDTGYESRDTRYPESRISHPELRIAPFSHVSRFTVRRAHRPEPCRGTRHGLWRRRTAATVLSLLIERVSLSGRVRGGTWLVSRA